MFHQTRIIIGSQDSIDTTLQGYIQSLIGDLIHDPQTHPDIIIHTEEQKNSIGIDAIRNIINFSFTKPYQSKNKLVVIKSCNKLTIQAQNALLKLVEEPPEFVQILLTETKEPNLIETIFSRCILEKLEDKEPNNIDVSDLAKSFLLGSVIERYNSIDKLHKIGTPHERIETAENLLTSLAQQIRISKSSITTIKNNLTLINDTYIKLRSNGNFKLIFDNLAQNLIP
ncbi:hypothetical protein KC717_05945 [Candidatus Dojkabacteria bacterium]|uniref:DNA polymerase III subunit delta n=1 Tax=Candidatus Dojkabacteria bacterium TaxID=2099670 RepID=A0A955L8R2_9BACT|nr:hypothetical protein [Candidatus Dojkabacteria bacterium]